MAIPIRKLALYTAGCGIHPSLTLPVSLDVGTDNPALLADPLYLGYRAPRLRGAEYDALVEAFVVGVEEVWPGCLIQFEDFKQQNALRLLDRYQSRVPCSATTSRVRPRLSSRACLASLRSRAILGETRVVLAGEAAGIRIARLLRLAVSRRSRWSTRGARPRRSGRPRRDQVGAGRPGRGGPRTGPRRDDRTRQADDSWGRPGWPRSTRPWLARWPMRSARRATSRAAALQPDLVGGGHRGRCPRLDPDGRALVATGSPFEAVTLGDGRRVEVGQANNVFIFPGVGLGAIVAEGADRRRQDVPPRGAQLAAFVTDERLATAPCPHAALREVSRSIAIAVTREAGMVEDRVGGRRRDVVAGIRPVSASSSR